MLRFENRNNARKHWFVTLVTLENTPPGEGSSPDRHQARDGRAPGSDRSGPRQTTADRG